MPKTVSFYETKEWDQFCRYDDKVEEIQFAIRVVTKQIEDDVFKIIFSWSLYQAKEIIRQNLL